MATRVNAFKRSLLLFFTCFLFTLTHAQNANWILGTWYGTGTNDNKVQFIKTIVIDSVYGTRFSGTRTNELKDRSRAKIVTSFSGYIDHDLIYIQNGVVLYKKEPPNGQWTDCSACLPETKVTINSDKIILTSSITGCQRECNSVSIYYKSLCDYDTSTQRYLINHFGSSSDGKAFSPCIQQSPELIAARQKEIDDSIAVAKKRQQHVQDSITTAKNIAKQKEEQRVKDSIATAAVVAKKRQKEIDDSIAIAKKRQQHIQDSITTANNIAKQKEEQHVKDSITTAAAIAKKRQKEIDDSIAVAKKRQQHIEDSITTANNIAKQKEEQRVKDSIAAAAAIARKNTGVVADTAKTSTTKALETRDNVLLQTYHITTPDILIELFDNAQIDGDRVSVYHNNSLIVNNQMLVREPITIKIHADAADRTHEFVMIAENLGTIPPNTALMRITVGTQVYKLSVKTDLKTNAKIVFSYDGN